jgi:invasion protein IalB
MSQLTKPLVLALTLGMAHGAYAQDATTATDQVPPAADAATPAAPASDATAPAADAATPATDAPAADATAPAADAAAPAAPQQPESNTYVKATYDSWEMQCIKTKDGKDPCQMYQVIKDANGGNVADISLFGLPAGGKAVAGATIMVPMDTLLTQNLTIQVDSAEPRVYPFTFCQPMGCFARIGLTQGELDAYKKGSKATITIVPLAAPNQKVTADISLKGFTNAYNAVVKSNEETGAVK